MKAWPRNLHEGLIYLFPGLLGLLPVFLLVREQDGWAVALWGIGYAVLLHAAWYFLQWNPVSRHEIRIGGFAWRVNSIWHHYVTVAREIAAELVPGPETDDEVLLDIVKVFRDRQETAGYPLKKIQYGTRHLMTYRVMFGVSSLGWTLSTLFMAARSLWGKHYLSDTLDWLNATDIVAIRKGDLLWPILVGILVPILLSWLGRAMLSLLRASDRVIWMGMREEVRRAWSHRPGD
jgi:hypothetical protein